MSENAISGRSESSAQRGTLERRVKEIFLTELQVEVPDRETDIMATGLVNSLAFVRLLSLLEQEFQLRIEVDELDLDDFRTVSSIVEFLERKRTSGAEAVPAGGD